MNFNKILVAGIIGLVTAIPSHSADMATETPDNNASSAVVSQDSTAGKGGFYTGLNTGVSFNRYKFKSAGSTKNFNKNSTGYLLEAFLGYDKQIKGFMVGADFGIGFDLSGKMNFTAGDVMSSEDMAAYNAKQTDTSKQITTDTSGNMRRKYTFSLVPRVGYLITPEFELFLNAGVNVSGFRINPALKQGGKSKTKVMPLVGVGARYDFSNTMFASISYNFVFDTTVDSFTNATNSKSMKNRTQIVKLGLGIRL